MADRNVTGLERIAVNEKACDERGEQRDKQNGGEERMAEEKFKDAGGRIGRDGKIGTKGEIILARDFNREHGEDHSVGVVHVEHEASHQSENQPLRKRARRARFAPIPKKKGHGEGRMRMRPRGIEIHVHRKRARPPDG